MKKDAFHPINDLSIHFLSFLNLISFPPFLLPVLYVVLKLHSHVHNYTSPSSRASLKTRSARFSSIDFLLILTFLSSYVFFFASHSDNRIVHTLSMYQLIYTRPLLFGFLNGWDIGTVRSRLCLLNKCTPNVIRFPGRSKRVSLSSSLHNSTLPRTLWSPQSCISVHYHHIPLCPSIVISTTISSPTFSYPIKLDFVWYPRHQVATPR